MAQLVDRHEGRRSPAHRLAEHRRGEGRAKEGRVADARDEGEARVRAAYPGSTWDRLAAIKGRYDPTNLFRLNQNIPPVAEEAAT